MSNQQKPAGNLTAFNARHHRFPEIEAAVEKFDADLDAQFGATPTPANVALKAAAVANFAGVLLVRNRLLASRGRYHRIEGLLTLLPTITGSLLRTMRLLAGHSSASDDPDSPPRGGIADYLRERDSEATDA